MEREDSSGGVSGAAAARLCWAATPMAEPTPDDPSVAPVDPPAPRRSAVRRAGGLLGHVATDITPLRVSRDYRMLWSGNLVSTAGRQFTVVALPYQVYLLTRSNLAVGGIGLVQLVPLVALSLAGGAIADRMDRRRLLLITNVLLAGGSALLTVAALLHWDRLWLLYLLAGLIAGVAAVDQPTRSATIPRLVRPEHLASALSLNFGGFQVTLIAGPALAGVVLAHVGLGYAYLIDAVTFAAAIAAVLAISPQPPLHSRREPVLLAVRRGLEFAVRQRVLLGSFLCDIVAMVFGMRRALFPVLATSVYHVGAGGLGLMYMALAVGGVVAALTGGWIGRTRRQGRIVVGAVAVWGLSVVGLGLAPSFAVAMLALAVGGAADAYSAVSRSTIMQTITPDELRGRLSAVYSMVVVGGPNLGDIEAGSVASAFSPAASIVSGGVLCVVGIGALVLATPQLLAYRARYFTEARPAEGDAGTAGSA
jgi:MFS family permease